MNRHSSPRADYHTVLSAIIIFVFTFYSEKFFNLLGDESLKVFSPR